VRQITAFSYIALNPKLSLPDATPPNRSVIENAKTSVPPLNLHAIQPEGVRRAIAIVVDDFGLSFESIARLRSSLDKFIQEQTLETDLIAVIRTSGGPGAIQQFTSNRAQILATVKRMRWYPTGRGGMSATTSFGPIENDENGRTLEGYSSNLPPDLSSKEPFGGSLGALGLVIQGLSRFPGRKSVVFISDNLPATGRGSHASGATRALDTLIERANQSSIVISTIDARGLSKPGLTADDSQYNLAANQIETRSRNRQTTFVAEQDALSYLARQTGGVFIHGNNDLTDGLRQVIDNEQGYYLLAYRPDDADNDAGAAKGRTYKVSLRLKRPGLELRTRSGFHRTTVKREVEGPIKQKEDFLREALASPFVREGVRLKVTALFTGGSQIKILLHCHRLACAS
jgi:VWFA-related protein